MSPKREILRFLQNIKLFARFKYRQILTVENSRTQKISLNDIDVLYINLDNRNDRRQHITSEFQRIGIKHAERIPAIHNEMGALGCTQSHVKTYQKIIKENKDKITMICEDDVEFIASASRIENIINYFSRNEWLDVLCLAYNRQNGIFVSDEMLISSKIKTTACYLVKPHAVPSLLKAGLISEENLSKGKPTKKFAIDITWQLVQEKLIFGIPQPRVARQIPSFSDVTKLHADYGL